MHVYEPHRTSPVELSDDQFVDVWKHNLNEELARISELVQSYPYIAVDTEFPGVVVAHADPHGGGEEKWQNLRNNVNLLKLIQVGITLTNARGEVPEGACTWQFHFHFDLANDMYAQDSIDLLQQAGIDFDRLKQDGIDQWDFAVAITGSGLVLNDSLTWIAFHSGYDFAYMLKMLTGEELTESDAQFHELLITWFHRIYDVKSLVKQFSISNELPWHRGLNAMAATLGVERIGPAHQAGSDSYVTALVFWSLQSSTLLRNVDLEHAEVVNTIFGLDICPPEPTTPPSQDEEYEPMTAAPGQLARKFANASQIPLFTPSRSYRPAHYNCSAAPLVA
eukprot:NODE_759_length_1657_cov_142.803922_g749_i0.p1 GENE.NODE_759_length_1657_cov_142.803922_g749_i0~~NODE_759_length_1657_cov_142.803922_g749_i0.p1  ORF type:complete len:372 (+),score=64.28 NODE_759_length_1657_cov_142.803922_g749_i0:111-1118(+)